MKSPDGITMIRAYSKLSLTLVAEISEEEYLRLALFFLDEMKKELNLFHQYNHSQPSNKYFGKH